MALKYKVIRCVAYTIEIILLFILQELPYLMPSLLGVRPLLLIAAPMTIAILENEKIGLGFGVFAGLLMDMGYGSVIGFHAIALGVLGCECRRLLCNKFFIGLLAVNLVKTNVLTSLLCTAAAVFAVISLHFVFFYLLRGYDMASYAYQKYYLPMMLYSFLPTPILYYFNKAFVVGVRERETI